MLSFEVTPLISSRDLHAAGGFTTCSLTDGTGLILLAALRSVPSSIDFMLISPRRLNSLLYVGHTLKNNL